MTANVDTRLAPRQRLARGLKYSTVGPVDVTRGVVGISANTVSAAVAGLRSRYESGKLRRQLAAAAQTVAALPEVLQEAAAAPQAKPRRRRRLLLAGVAVATLAGGAVAFSIVRRSTKPEPSPLPPSVEVTPKP
ncbi:cell wall synthesis protein CwsA [Mycolicibacterium porcinum]|nr:cell wall synthesis protein CwsA [Mycolicibacterium porcinum]